MKRATNQGKLREAVGLNRPNEDGNISNPRVGEGENISNSSRSCDICGLVFTLFKRRHHCRICGSTVCGSCGKTRALVYTSYFPKRCCDHCSRTLVMMTQQNDSRIKLVRCSVTVTPPNSSVLDPLLELEMILGIAGVSCIQTQRSFIISSKWLVQWYHYVAIDEYSMNRFEENNRYSNATRPGPVGNFDIIDFNAGELRPYSGLRSWNAGSGDYFVTSEAEWVLYVHMYGGGPAIWFNHDHPFAGDPSYWNTSLDPQDLLTLTEIRNTRRNTATRMRDIAVERNYLIRNDRGSCSTEGSSLLRSSPKDTRIESLDLTSSPNEIRSFRRLTPTQSTTNTFSTKNDFKSFAPNRAIGASKETLPQPLQQRSRSNIIKGPSYVELSSNVEAMRSQMMTDIEGIAKRSVLMKQHILKEKKAKKQLNHQMATNLKL